MLKPVFAVIGLLSAIGVISPAIAASSKQFDLLCKGQEHRRTGEPASAWSEHFRIDLDARRWCRGACAAPAEIGSATADEIVIYDSRASIGGPAEAQLTLLPVSGKVTESVMMGYSGFNATLAEGTCRREFFSGFPVQRF